MVVAEWSVDKEVQLVYIGPENAQMRIVSNIQGTGRHIDKGHRVSLPLLSGSCCIEMA